MVNVTFGTAADISKSVDVVVDTVIEHEVNTQHLGRHICMYA